MTKACQLTNRIDKLRKSDPNSPRLKEAEDLSQRLAQIDDPANEYKATPAEMIRNDAQSRVKIPATKEAALNFTRQAISQQYATVAALQNQVRKAQGGTSSPNMDLKSAQDAWGKTSEFQAGELADTYAKGIRDSVIRVAKRLKTHKMSPYNSDPELDMTDAKKTVDYGLRQFERQRGSDGKSELRKRLERFESDLEGPGPKLREQAWNDYVDGSLSVGEFHQALDGIYANHGKSSFVKIDGTLVRRELRVNGRWADQDIKKIEDNADQFFVAVDPEVRKELDSVMDTVRQTMSQSEIYNQNARIYGVKDKRRLAAVTNPFFIPNRNEDIQSKGLNEAVSLLSKGYVDGGGRAKHGDGVFDSFNNVAGRWDIGGSATDQVMLDFQRAARAKNMNRRNGALYNWGDSNLTPSVEKVGVFKDKYSYDDQGRLIINPNLRDLMAGDVKGGDKSSFFMASTGDGAGVVKVKSEALKDELSYVATHPFADAPILGPLYRGVSGVSRARSMAMTVFHPPFFISEYFRTLAYTNISVTARTGIGGVPATLANVPASVSFVSKLLTTGKENKSSSMYQAYKHLEDFGVIQNFNAGTGRSVFENIVRDAQRGRPALLSESSRVMDMFAIPATIAELAPRIAGMKALLDKGVAPSVAAAQMNKVQDFSQRGRQDQNVWDLFLRQNFNGIEENFRVITQGQHKSAAMAVALGYGTMVAGIHTSFALAALEDDEDPEKLPIFRQSSSDLMTRINVAAPKIPGLNNDGKVSIPMLHGLFGTLSGLASMVMVNTAAQQMGMSTEGRELGDMIDAVRTSVISNATPLDRNRIAEGNYLSAVGDYFVPGSLQPAFELGFNEDDFGREIYNPDKTKFDHTTGSPTGNFGPFAQALYNITGVDVDPDALDYLAKQFGKGPVEVVRAVLEGVQISFLVDDETKILSQDGPIPTIYPDSLMYENYGKALDKYNHAKRVMNKAGDPTYEVDREQLQRDDPLAANRIKAAQQITNKKKKVQGRINKLKRRYDSGQVNLVEYRNQLAILTEEKREWVMKYIKVYENQ